LAFGLSSAAQAAPVTIEEFNFTGTCTDCGGTAPQFGTGTLTLQNYTLGKPIDNTLNYVSFTYHSRLLDLSLTSANSMIDSPFFPVLSILPTSLPGPANVFIFDTSGTVELFGSGIGGGWCAGVGCGTDNGNMGTYTETPLPTALPLFATGLGALGLLGWRRKRKARAV
jgi:hypothetical protein